MKAYTFSELAVGHKESFSKRITKADIMAFSKMSGDKNPLHLDKDYATATSFKKPVVYGLLINSLFSTLAGMHLPGKYSLILRVESDFKKPCYVNDLLLVSGEITRKTEAGNLLEVKTSVRKSSGEIAVSGKMLIKVLK